MSLQVEVHGAVDRGLLVNLTGVRGFIPASHVPKIDGQVLSGQQLKVRCQTTTTT